MPEYEYLCTGECACNFSIFYKSLPSEKKQKEAVCPDCDAVGKRVLSQFLMGGTQNSSFEKLMGNNAETVDVGGRKMPAFRDANGKLHEVRTMGDMKLYQKSNQYGTPRMVSWRNHITGETSMVPQRVKMIADPVSGEPMDAPTIKESVELVPIDHFEIPSETKSGIPLDPKTGTPKVRDISKLPIPGTKGVIDPQTGQPMTMGTFWGSEGAGLSNRAAAKEMLKAQPKMTRHEVGNLLSREE